MKVRVRFRVLALFCLLLPVEAGAQGGGDAYADAAARELVTRARERRGIIDLSITEYRTRSTERISVGLRLLRRERLLYRREAAAQVHWQRGGTTEIEVLGVREVVPVASGAPQIPGDLHRFMPHIAFDPLDSEFLFRFDTTFIRHPLAPGAEADYRYATGDSTVVRLTDGRQVRLRELRITPRRPHPQLIAGSFWLHTESYAVVQAAFRLSQPYSSRQDEDAGLSRFILPALRMDFSHFVVDYGLWDLRWWLPRSLLVEGVIEIGSLGALPLQYERSYRDYDVEADSARAALLAGADSLRERCRGVRSFALVVNVGGDAEGRVQTDSARARLEAARVEQLAEADSLEVRCLARYRVSIPHSVPDVIASPDLPPSIYGESELLSELELDQLEALARRLPPPLWRLAGTRLEIGPTGPGLLRYNRVEGLGIGARARAGFGPAAAALEVGYGLADEWPKAAAELHYRAPARTVTLRGFRELRPFDPQQRPFSFSHSISALLLGRDDALYYRAAGASLELAPAPTHTQWYALRTYFERQSATRAHAEFSLPHLLDADHRFAANALAQPAKQAGADVVLRADRGSNPRALRLGAQLDVRAEAGTFDFVRPALTLRAALPPVLGVAAGVEAAAGTTFSAAPVQSHWYLGGSTTLRGYPAAAASGEAFWRARGELGTSLPLLRLTLFTDAGWAGVADMDAARAARPLLSAGAGISLLDGVVRLDVARALRAPTGWRAHFYLDGVL